MLKRILTLLFLISHSVFIWSQEQEIVEEVSQSLYEQTLYNDINSASYYELLTWCREENLDEKGSIDKLKSQLYIHYKIDLNSKISKDLSNSTIVKIISADSSNYYTVDETEEEYVRISGRVKLIVKEGGKNVSHSITADSVIFNQTINTMTAIGSIEYVKDENGKLEEFTGDSLTFNVQTWKGVILKGDFKKIQKVGEQDIEFIFSGDSIYKGEGDVVILNDGSISSCDLDDKHYQIKAKKIWVLGPDEWALLSAVLYIGNIPVLYIPFYHLPGNDMFFNPAIGTDTRRGYFIQTTSYLYGRKENTSDDDSFFINMADSDGSYRLEPHGLFLFKIKSDEEKINNDFVKFKLDYYSRLGGFIALEGAVEQLWQFKTLNFNLGLAVSKSIKTPQSGVNNFHTNYFSQNNFIEEWNNSYFLGLQLPFRWTTSLNFKFFTFSFQFQYISDPFFYNDFTNRDENFDWLNYLLEQTKVEEDETVTTTNNLKWSLSGNVSIPNAWAGQYINNFSISGLTLEMKWNKKNNTLYDSANLNKPYDPGREFFYPDIVTFPKGKLSLAGVFLDFSTISNKGLEKTDKQGENQLRSPWNLADIDSNDDSELRNDEDDFKKSIKFDDFKDLVKTEIFSTKIFYSLSGDFNLLSYTRSSVWTDPTEIDFSFQKSVYTNKNVFTLNYELGFIDDIIGLKGKNSFALDYTNYIGNRSNGDISTDEVLKEKNDRKSKWGNDLTLTIHPLKKITYFDKSSVNYTFNTLLYRYIYDTSISKYENKWMAWNKDAILAHKTSANLEFGIPNFTFKTTFSTSLPPLDIVQNIQPYLSFSFFYWENSIDISFKYESEKWLIEPLNIRSTFNPIEWFYIKETLKYNFEESHFENSTSELHFWYFDAKYTMAYTNDYEWNKNLTVLEDKGKKFLPSNISLSFNPKFESEPLWKNRITMDFSLTTSFTMDLQRYNLTKLNWGFAYNLHISKFIDLKFDVNSSNEHMFLYFPGLRDYYGITTEYNFFEDLLKSFNVFSPNQQDRYDSFFNLNSINLSIVHKLHDWDLTLTYNGKPIIEPAISNTAKWDSTLSITIRWNPIEKIKIKVDHKEEEWIVDTELK